MSTFISVVRHQLGPNALVQLDPGHGAIVSPFRNDEYDLVSFNIQEGDGASIGPTVGDLQGPATLQDQLLHQRAKDMAMAWFIAQSSF